MFGVGKLVIRQVEVPVQPASPVPAPIPVAAPVCCCWLLLLSPLPARYHFSLYEIIILNKMKEKINTKI